MIAEPHGAITKHDVPIALDRFKREDRRPRQLEIKMQDRKPNDETLAAIVAYGGLATRRGSILRLRRAD